MAPRFLSKLKSRVGLQTSRTAHEDSDLSRMPATEVAHSPTQVDAASLPTSELEVPAHDDSQMSLSSLQEQLWNQAYDELKMTEPKLTDMYETVLSNVLSLNDSAGNLIGKTPDTRSQQMRQLVQHELDRTERTARFKQRVGEGLEIVQVVRGVIDKAIQAAPQAAVAWAGVCLGLEIISKPATEAHSNRQGIAYVLLRMNWYWSLAQLLLDKNKAVGSSAGLRDILESHLVQLYQKLLLYQIKTICLYHRNQLVTIGRDLLSLDNWAGQLNDIKDAEVAVQRDAEQYSSEQIKAYIDALKSSAVSQEQKLDEIHSAIQNGSQKQEERYKDEKDKQCLKDLYETDPKEDKKRIEETKGGLLRDSYVWILENTDFQQFRHDEQNRLLWVTSDPGKGKTMLLCGIIDELRKDPNTTLAYFFCQATEPRLSNATSVLRGLVYFLLVEQPGLISHLRKKYDTTGQKLFEGLNVWVSLVEIFTDILQDPALQSLVLVVDALDECANDRTKLLDVITQSASSSSSRVKWIVSSRDWPDIEEKLDTPNDRARLRLELNQSSISSAVKTYINYKLDQLVRIKNYNDELRAEVHRHLVDNADGTFLWVALVCHELSGSRVKKRHTLEMLQAMPSGLSSLYRRMVGSINASSDAALCREVMAITSTVYRPVHLGELIALSEPLSALDRDELVEVIRLCGSFLTLRGDIIYFIHQSAKDYLLMEVSSFMLPSGIAYQHYVISINSLDALSRTLRRNICSLESPAPLADQTAQPDLNVLAPIEYSVVYWVDHLDACRQENEMDHHELIKYQEIVHKFLENNYLYWLEASSLLNSISEAVLGIHKLIAMTTIEKSPNLSGLLEDSRRFILSHRAAIEVAPLQVYISALIFSPTGSMVRKLFKHEEPHWITLKPSTTTDWDDCLQTLEGHSHTVNQTAFSHDSTLIASASSDRTIRIWQLNTSMCTQKLVGHTEGVNSVAFSHNSRLLATAAGDATVRVWCTKTGDCLQTYTGHRRGVLSAAFSRDSQRVASVALDGTIQVWGADTGACLQTTADHTTGLQLAGYSCILQELASEFSDEIDQTWQNKLVGCSEIIHGQRGLVQSTMLSRDLNLMAISTDSIIEILEVDTGKHRQTLKRGRSRFSIEVIDFSPDSKLLATTGPDEIVQLWCLATGKFIKTLAGHNLTITSVLFSPNSELVASSSWDHTIRIWRTKKDNHTHVIQGHTDTIYDVVFSPDSRLIASASKDGTIGIWCANTGGRLNELRGHDGGVDSVVFSHSSTHIASSSSDNTIRIWRLETGECTLVLEDPKPWPDLRWIAFSYDSEFVATAVGEHKIRIWDIDKGECVHILEGHTGCIESVAFSYDSIHLASISQDNTIRIWHAGTGQHIQSIDMGISVGDPVNFYYDGTHVACGPAFEPLKLWRVDTGQCTQIFKGEENWIASRSLGKPIFSHDSALLASCWTHEDDEGHPLGKSIRIWRVATGECTHSIPTRSKTKLLAFRPDDAYLQTNHGPIVLGSADSTCKAIEAAGNVPLDRPTDFGLSEDEGWITRDGEKLVWLPAEFRPGEWAVSGSTIVIGTWAGRIATMAFSESGDAVFI